MKVLCLMLLALISFELRSQSYVDSGIQKYQLGQFEEAIVFFNKGYELRDALPSASIARIFLYRGMSKLEVLKSSGQNREAGITVQEVYADIENSVKYENVWPAKLEETRAELFDVGMNLAENSDKLARKENDYLLKISHYTDRIGYLKIALNLNSSSSAGLLLAETHKNIGDTYFAVAEEFAEFQIAKQNYEEAIKYFEIARYDDPYSKDIIEALLVMSNRLMDQPRIDEYKKLLELAGG